MALITTAAREELIALFVGMFKAAPGATNLSQMVSAWEAGQTMTQISASLAAKPDFSTVYPSLLTADEFATSLVATLLDSGVPQAAKDWGKNWVVTALTSGKARSQVILEAVQAIRATTNTNYTTAKAQLANMVEVASYYSITQLQSNSSLAALQNVISTVTATASTVAAAKAVIDGNVADALGVVYSLTTGVDTIKGNAGNDTINGTISDSSTLTSLDNVDGGGGKDTFNISSLVDFALPAAVTVTNVEVLGIAAAAKVGTFTADGAGNIDLSTAFAGITSLTISGAPTEVDVKAPSTAAVTLAGATSGVEIVGGTSQAVTLSAQGGNLKLSGGTGALSVTSSKQGANTITLDNGTDVTLTTGGALAATQGAIVIGGTTRPTGVITVTNTPSISGSDQTGAAITVSGGTSVTVSQTARQTLSAVDAGTNYTLTQGAITVNGGTATTSVTTSQSATATAAATKIAVTATTEVATMTFKALAAGETQIINGLTFTAGTSGTTAAETAAAFANLENGARQGYGTKGTYSGTFSTEGWTTGAASGDVVVFTASSAGTRTDLADTGTGADPTIVITQGVAAVTAAGKGGVVQGAVAIDDVNVGTEVDTITTVSVTGYATGSTVKSDALTTLTLAANTASSSMAVHNNTATTLGLTLNTLATGSTVNLDAAAAKYTALNITASGGNSTANITAAAVTALTVAGDKTVNLTGSTFTVLKSTTVSGSAGITLVAPAVAGSSVSTAGTTGSNTITIDGAVTTYTGGAGKDTVTLATSTALTKAIDLGDGDDTLSFAALNVTGSTATLSGGAGTDTLSMATATADALDGAVQTFYTNFERLLVNNAAGSDNNTADTVTLNLANLGFTNYVTTTGTVLDTTTAANSDTLLLDNLANGGTVVIAASAAGANTKHTVNIKDAATGTADVLNLTLSSTAGLNNGVVTVANTETVNVTTVDLDVLAANTDTVVVTAAAATKVTAAGGGTLNLTLTGSTKVTTIDGSARTGALVVTSLNTTSATTITGGAGNDTLTAATGSTADVLNGGAGNDTLTANAGLSTLTGGAGNDTFVITTASTNVNSYATITDATKGDYIQFTNVGTPVFKSAAVTLGDTAVFQDYANAAINSLALGEIGWFQFGGNTYIVQDGNAAQQGNGTTFFNGDDYIVKLTGLINLATASFDTAAVEIRIG